MKVAVFGQFDNNFPKEHVSLVINHLLKHNLEIYLESKCAEKIKEIFSNSFATFSSHLDLDNSFDFLISIGGDGTILRALSFIRDLNIPIIGVNSGRLGFLATIQKENIEKSLNNILNNQYTISERSILALETLTPLNENEDPFNYALNEIAVSRKNTTSMITVKTFLNSQHLTSYWADGLIVATPTGSTGYSLSCGGPVISPSAKSFVLTPIAPHNLNARPLVIPDDTTITLKVSGREEFHLVSLDSRILTVKNETELIIKKAPFTIKMITPKGENFLKTLRNKLLWGEDKRN
ncbi:NAD kinase [Pseudofulvibacter geojedonensis]|uniref:NAD kinase n=1 Tax=Pseudofulvibacter geojedonensis TaxID=1123758 RepID=A0ABW3I5J7_9FLAO